MKQAYKRAISIHTVATKMQNRLALAGMAAPASILKKITAIDLWISKISMCFSPCLSNPIKTKKKSLNFIVYRERSDRITSKKTRFEGNGRRRRLKKKTGERKQILGNQGSNKPETYSTTCNTHNQLHLAYTFDFSGF